MVYGRSQPCIMQAVNSNAAMVLSVPFWRLINHTAHMHAGIGIVAIA
jgi:hypothetical protein